MSDVYNSKIAKLFGKIHNDNEYAVTTSKNCSRYSVDESLVTDHWRLHENEHKKQYAELGWCNFMIQYIWESIIHGYTNNKFEVAARKAAGDV